MTEQMTPLRRRMIDDMAIRNMSPNTQKIYIRAVANFSAYHGQSPDKLTFEDVREYQLHLASCGLKVRTTNVTMCALRFFYGTTLGKLNVSEHIAEISFLHEPAPREGSALALEQICPPQRRRMNISGAWRLSQRARSSSGVTLSD